MHGERGISCENDKLGAVGNKFEAMGLHLIVSVVDGDSWQGLGNRSAKMKGLPKFGSPWR